LVRKTLHHPVDRWVEKTHVLFVVSSLAATGIAGIVDFEHEVYEQEEVVLLFGDHLVADTCQVRTSISSTKWLSNTSHNFRHAQQVRLMHTHVSELNALKQSELEVDSGEDFSNADALEQPIPAGLNDTLWQLIVVN